MINHDNFLRHLVRKAISQLGHFREDAWVDARIAEARETYLPPSDFPQAAEHDVDVRYNRGCMR